MQVGDAVRRNWLAGSRYSQVQVLTKKRRGVGD